VVGVIPKLVSEPTTNAPDVAASFIRAALDASKQTIRALTNPAYQQQAITLWISAAGPTGRPLIAAQVLDQAAGTARIAVFVDSGTHLNIAALPYTVQLLEDPTTRTWTVIDAGLATP
jgi:hypothetical protein